MKTGFKSHFIISLISPLVIIGLLFSIPVLNSDNSESEIDTIFNVQYYRLNLARDHYIYLSDNGLWVNHLFKADTGFSQTDQLIMRLIHTGDIYYKNDSIDIASSLRNYQLRHGLKDTGILDNSTVKELNISIKERISTIDINIERFKKIFPFNQPKYILVNTADYKLQLIENRHVSLEMDVIIGRTYRKTPEFSSEITHLVFNPDWTIPPTILRADVLPIIKRDPTYLSRKGISVYKINKDGTKTKINPAEINWNNISPGNFPYQLVQKPGIENPLGVVKFIFPNKYNVYMHDTPSKELFERSDKTFSSGCIRLSKAIDLADSLLKGQGWDMEKIKEIIHSGRIQTEYLHDPVKVVISYFTCWVDDNGQVHFRKDIYGKDINFSI